jgi:hypothetical protein
MYSPSVPWPDAPVSEWTAIRKSSASGLFAYRHLQAAGLLDSPDYGGGDLTEEQRREALRHAVYFRKPLAALAIFLGVVALEDFVRDFGARLADHARIASLFPTLARLRSKPISRAPGHAFKRLDTDPTGFVDPEEINVLFHDAFSVQPIPVAEFPRLRDLALIRHTVAHHAAVIRKVDVPRFQYYIVRPGQAINPPEDFVRDVLQYLYQTGISIERAIRDQIFSALLSLLPSDWSTSRPPQLIDLIEFFDYFGFLETARGPVGYADPRDQLHHEMQRDAARIRELLITRCIEALQRP